jgi:hypothetical protein
MVPLLAVAFATASAVALAAPARADVADLTPLGTTCSVS